MNYVIDVPEPIQTEIGSWGLSYDAEDALYAHLERGLTQAELDALWRVPGPGFVWVYNLDLQDPLLLGITHVITFWLVYTAQDGHLAIHQCQHRQIEDWGTDATDDDLPDE